VRIEVTEVPASALPEYARVPIAFEVSHVIDVAEAAGGGFVLTERRVDAPWTKDYDALPGEGPAAWGRSFDLSRWGFFAARDPALAADRWSGAAAAVLDAPGVDLLDGRRDHAVLWDLRIAPDGRRRGVGTALLRAVEAWAAARGARQLSVETQQVNVPACRFYARHGFMLATVRRDAYPSLPEEVQLLWRKALAAGAR
jgi:ribosomal protein S18 acetylase RimI-like enzyme